MFMPLRINAIGGGFLSNGLKLAALYITIIMGAGFASGQELLQYFVSFGTSGIWGLIAAGIIFGLTGWAVLDICRQHKLGDYRALIGHLCGKRIGMFLEWLVAAFLFVLFVAMLSASGAMLQQATGLPFTIGVLVAAGLTMAALWFGLDGIVWINAVFAPIMLVGGIFIGLYTFFNQAVTTGVGFENVVVPGWIVAAVVYASYNMITGVSVLASGSRIAETPGECMAGGLLGGLALTLLGICMALPLYLHFADIIAVEIPFLVIVVGYGWIFTALYVMLMLCAILTTAIINAFALSEWTAGYSKMPKRLQCGLIVAFAVPAAYIGFSNIVGYVYPLFGFLGLFQIILILLSWIKSRQMIRQ